MKKNNSHSIKINESTGLTPLFFLLFLDLNNIICLFMLRPGRPYKSKYNWELSRFTLIIIVFCQHTTFSHLWKFNRDDCSRQR